MARDRKDRSESWFMAHHGGSLLRLAPVGGVARWEAAQNVLAYPKQIPDGLLDVTFVGKDTADPFLIEIEAYPNQDTVRQIRRDLAMVMLARGVIADIIVVVLQPNRGRAAAERQLEAGADANCRKRPWLDRNAFESACGEFMDA